MKKTLLGLLVAGLMLSTGAPAVQAGPRTQAPVPVRIAADTAADRVEEMKEETGTAFEAADFEVTKASGGTVQLTKKGEVVITLDVTDESPDKAVTTGIDIVKAAGKDVNVSQQPAENNGDGLKGHLAMGSCTIDGKSLQWFVGAVESGKKTLRMIVLSSDLKSSEGFKAFTHSLKKG